MRKQQLSIAHNIFFSKISLAIELAIFIVLAITFTKTVATRQAIQTEIKKAQADIALLREKEQSLAYQKLGASSSSFAEIQAKQKLNLRRPGEDVIVFKKSVTDASADNQPPKKSNLQLWIDYFFR